MTTKKAFFLVHNIAWKGGAFYHAYGFARQLAVRNYEVTILAIAPKEHYRFVQSGKNGVMVIETPDLAKGLLRSGWDPWDVVRRSQYLRRREADIVHCVDTRPAVILPAVWSHKKMGAKLVTDWTDWFGRGGVSQVRPGVPPVLRKLFAPVETYFEERFHYAADGIMTISTQLYDRAVGLGLKRKPLVLIRPGCDTDRLKPLNTANCRSQLGLDDKLPTIGFLGALAPADGDLLLKAMECLRASLPKAQLLLIGNHRLPLSFEQKKMANVVETSFVPDDKMNIYLSACDVLVLPMSNTLANRARWPSKINDYLSVGRPVVATAIGGDVTEIIRSHKVGLAVPDESEEIAKALLSVLSDSDARREMGENARALAEGDLSWSKSISSLENFYEEVLSRN